MENIARSLCYCHVKMRHYIPELSGNLIIAFCWMNDAFTNEHGNDEGVLAYMYQIVDEILENQLQPDDPRLNVIGDAYGNLPSDVHIILLATFRTERKTKSVADIRRLLHQMIGLRKKILGDCGIITSSDNPSNQSIC